MRPGIVMVSQVSGQDPSQTMLVDDQHPAQKPRRRVPILLSQIAFVRGACGGLARIGMASALKTASSELVNWPARSLIRNLTEVAPTVVGLTPGADENYRCRLPPGDSSATPRILRMCASQRVPGD